MKKVDQHFDIAKEILDQTEKELKNLPPVNILLIGKSGVGKSTLVNSIFRERIADTGIGKPVTKHLQKVSRKDVPITIYDTRGLELSVKVQKEVKNEIFNLVEENKGSTDEIHIAYYCIQGTSSRIEEIEIKMIEEVSQKIPVLLLLTQAIGEQSKEFETLLNEMNLPVVGVHSVLATPYVITEEYTVQPFGLKELIERTIQVLPKSAQKAFINAQQVDIERKVQSAKTWANRYIVTTFGVGFTPIPFSDASIIVPMQITLLTHITVIFGIPIDRATILSVIAGVGGTGSATFLGRTIVSNAFKFIPGVGTIVGGIISGTTASIITRALADSYIQVLKVTALNELEGTTTKTERIISFVQKEFKKTILENRTELTEEKTNLETEQHGILSKLTVFKKTIENFTNKRSNRLN